MIPAPHRLPRGRRHRPAHSVDNIDTIGTLCGFADRYYITHVFRRVTGMPPAAYRRQALQTASGNAKA